MRGCAKDHLCGGCRITQRGVNPRARYFWTPEQEERLRAVYREARNKASLSSGITDVSRRTGFPRHIVRLKAQQLRLTVMTHHKWSAEELEYLANTAGEVSLHKIARTLKRSYYSVRSQMAASNLAGRYNGKHPTEGYSQREFAGVIGVSTHSVARWIDRGVLRLGGYGCDPARISEPQAQSFLRNHSREYDLRRVDQAWFKGMLFGGFGAKFDPKRAADRVDESEAAC